MKLNSEPFYKIKNGTKIYELRLYDEKRKQIHVGDVIEFTERDSLEKCTVQVMELCLFENFVELYAKLPLDKLGYSLGELDSASPADMEQYYSKEEQASCGVVAIKIKLIR
ncbi:MAG: RNA-binding protein [Clostridia bacterium]|nr:RNA-binding protein [Clostridia bacterium]